MIPAITLALVAVTAAVAQVVPQGTVSESSPMADVVLTLDNVPETIRAADGIIITNGTPDKRCWFFVPLPPQTQNPSGRRPSYYRPYYMGTWRYPFMTGRRPTNRPQNSGNNQNGNAEQLPMFEANVENQIVDENLQNEFPVNEDSYNENGFQAGANFDDYDGTLTSSSSF